MKYGLFNSVNGDRKYKSEEFSEYFATFIGNGIFVKPSDCLQIIAAGNSMNIIVRPGKAWINGRYLINDEDYAYALSPGDATLNRIDRIVVRCDYTERKMSVSVKKGALSASPVAPTLKRDADAYELALADIYVAKGALTVSQAAITDTRLNNSLCGLMHAVVNQVDTTTIFNQYQSWFNEYSVVKANEFLDWISNEQNDFLAWRTEEEALYYAWLAMRKGEFDTWFMTIKDILDTNAAGNLFNLIDEHKNTRLPHIQIDAVTGQKYATGWIVEDGALYFEYEER